MPSRKEPKIPDLKTLADPRKSSLHWEKNSPCQIASAAEALPENEREYLTRALDNTNARGIDIANALAVFDINVTSHDVQRHRVGVCPCENGN